MQCTIQKNNEFGQNFLPITDNDSSLQNFQYSKNNACRQKYLIKDKYETVTTYYNIFTGNEELEDVELKTKEIILKPASTKWEKKKADKDCQSEDPNDCLVWCLTETPATKKTLKILLDTTQSKNFESIPIKTKTLIRAGGFEQWKPVLCEEEITSDIISQLATKLTQNGFEVNPNTSSITPEFKNKLNEYQKSKDLPIGSLDYETLDSLQIVWTRRPYQEPTDQ